MLLFAGPSRKMLWRERKKLFCKLKMGRTGKHELKSQ